MNPSMFQNVLLTVITLTVLPNCATHDNPPCRRVSAREFMRPHTFKGIATEKFIGTTPKNAQPKGYEEKAFKEIWEMGMFNSWAVIWCPVAELPRDYLANAESKPNRKPPGAGDFIHE